MSSIGAAPAVVIMNDTSLRGHHGCSRVMRLLMEGLQKRGLRVLARSHAHEDWEADRSFVEALEQSDLVIVNGEGTLHHGRPAGMRLLSVIKHPARKRAPVALINAIWQDNPSKWFECLSEFSLVATRDRRSAETVAKGLGDRGPRQLCVPDLSLSAGSEPFEGRRDRLIVGDAVRLSSRRDLALAAARLGADALVPTKTVQGRIWNLWPMRRLLASAYYGANPYDMPPLELSATEADYLIALSHARMHVTGRFHALCLSLITGTPVLAVSSNSWKIEALLADAGIPSSRMIEPDQLRNITSEMVNRPFTDEETASISAFLAKAKAEAQTMFDELANLARHGQSMKMASTTYSGPIS